jgi:hypothetical protein
MKPKTAHVLRRRNVKNDRSFVLVCKAGNRNFLQSTLNSCHTIPDNRNRTACRVASTGRGQSSGLNLQEFIVV